MAGVLKKTTGLTGLAVSVNPQHSLGVLYKKILRLLQQMPQEAMYRKHTEPLISQRLKIIQSETDVSKLEAKINGGQAEELILQAENELILARKMLDWKPWQPLLYQPPPNQWKWPI